MTSFFRLFIIILIVFPTICFITFKVISGAIAEDADEDKIIYDNMLRDGWQNWSWSSTINFSSTDTSYSNNSVIEYISHGWGGLYFHTDAPIDPSFYNSLEISVKTKDTDSNYVIFVYDDTNNPVQSAVPLSHFGGSPPFDTWKTYVIPLHTINKSGKPIKGISIHENTGKQGVKLLVDNVKLKKNQQYSSDFKKSSIALYSDALEPNWENWSWGSYVDIKNTEKQYTGNASIMFSAQQAWSGMYFHTHVPIETHNLEYVRFAVFVKEDNQSYSLALHDEYGTITGDPIKLETYGTFEKNSWKLYTIPLSSLNAKGKRISGFIIQESKGHAQAPIYIDDVSFIGADRSVPIPTQIPIQQTVTSTPLPEKQSNHSSEENPFAGMNFYVHPDNNAKRTADEWRSAGRHADADQMMKIANSPWALWVVGGDPYAPVADYVSKASSQHTLPVIIAYNIPGRDCGQYSSGGSDYEEYKSWINKIADAVGDKKAVIILEPDALGLDCLQNENTYSLLRYAIDTLESKSQTSVYIDASSWVDTETIASRLNRVGIGKAQGFAVNISGFNTTDSMVQFGNTVSSRVGGKHFVIDTSRNGSGPYTPTDSEQWCNPPDRSLGYRPTSHTGIKTVDAFFWMKVPGESDGACRNGPNAGEWWPDYALGLAQRANY